MIRKLTAVLCLASLMLLLFIPTVAQEEGTDEGEYYPPECIDDPSLCEEPTSFEEWNAEEQEIPSGGEEYPDECYDDPDLCGEWETVEEWNEIIDEEEYYSEVEESSGEEVQYGADYVSTGAACPDNLDWSNYTEVRMIQVRAGYPYTATVIGIDGFDPVLAVMDQGGNGVCIDDEPQASGFSVTLPTTGTIDASDHNAQLTFSNNSGEEFADISLYVTNLNGESGEFVLVVEGMVVTDSDNRGDPFAVQITASMVASGVSATAYMIGATSELDPFVELIDQNYVTMQDTEGYWILCDDGGSENCWGDTSDLSGTAYVASNVYGEWYSGQQDTMLSLPLAEGFEGNYYTFLMKSFQQASSGSYVAAFHLAI